MAHKGLDCYLDSLFDPVLSYGDAVGTQQGVCRPQHGVCTQEALSARVWGGVSSLELCWGSSKG